jgi:HEAT repeat protein
VVLGASRFELPAVRAQSALALSRFPQVAAARRLAEMLEDADPGVRLAASAGILQALPGQRDS